MGSLGSSWSRSTRTFIGAERVRLIGPDGCLREVKVDAAGRFAVDGLAAGLYVVAHPWRDGWAEVRVTEGATASIDLRPVQREETRRDQRLATCGCPRPMAYPRSRNHPHDDRLYEPRPRFAPPT